MIEKTEGLRGPSALHPQLKTTPNSLKIFCEGHKSSEKDRGEKRCFLKCSSNFQPHFSFEHSGVKNRALGHFLFFLGLEYFFRDF